MSSSPKQMKNNVITRKTATTAVAARCMFKKYNCSHVPLPSYSFCQKHILEDRNAPFKQCSFVFATTGEKCTYAVANICGSQSRDAGLGLCVEHIREYEANRLKPKCKLLPPLPTADTILCGLSHYVKSNLQHYSSRKDGNLVPATADELLQQMEKDKNVVVDPFVNIDASEINSKTNETLNYSCEVDSDVDAATFDNVWENVEQDSSDTESVDFEFNDYLRYANVFTEEEIILAVRNHAVKLQTLCIQQYRRLLHLLRERKSKYLTEVKREKEIYGLLQKPNQLSLYEKKRYEQLRALARYQKTGVGPEALLFKKMLERRKAITPGLFVRSRNFNKCVYTEGGVRCSLRVIPSTKYCKKHILNDRYQILFQECGVQKKDHICKEPMVPLPNTVCTFHLTLSSDSLPVTTNISELEEQKKEVVSSTTNTNDEGTEEKEVKTAAAAAAAVMDVESDAQKIHLQKVLEGDTLDLLLGAYPPANNTLNPPSTSSTATTSDPTPSTQNKNITDELDLSMTDKIFDALENYFKI